MVSWSTHLIWPQRVTKYKPITKWRTQPNFEQSRKIKAIELQKWIEKNPSKLFTIQSSILSHTVVAAAGCKLIYPNQMDWPTKAIVFLSSIFKFNSYRTWTSGRDNDNRSFYIQYRLCLAYEIGLLCSVHAAKKWKWLPRNWRLKKWSARWARKLLKGYCK